MSTSPERPVGARRRAFADSPFEARYGFCRAVRVGERILVSGTAPVWPDGSCAADAGAQAGRCLEIIERALGDLGATRADVVRTRILITDASVADLVGEIHREFFATHPPAATMIVVAGLLDPRWKVEIEAEAIAGS